MRKTLTEKLSAIFLKGEKKNRLSFDPKRFHRFPFKFNIINSSLSSSSFMGILLAQASISKICLIPWHRTTKMSHPRAGVHSSQISKPYLTHSFKLESP